MLGLRKNNIFELGLVGAEGVHRGDTLDGSVKFVKSTVAPATWWAIGSRAAGEVVSADSY